MITPPPNDWRRGLSQRVLTCLDRAGITTQEQAVTRLEEFRKYGVKGRRRRRTKDTADVFRNFGQYSFYKLYDHLLEKVAFANTPPDDD